MLIIHRRLKDQPDDEWRFHELSTDKFPGGFKRESDWALRYKRRNDNPRYKHEYKVELKT
jgi:hypothetical protein